MHHTSIISRCKAYQPPPQATMKQSQLLVKLNIKWLKPPLAVFQLSNLATATATYGGIVETLTEANSRLARQLEDLSSELKEVNALLKRIELTETVRELQTLLQRNIVGLMETRWKIVTQDRVSNTPKTDTSMRPPMWRPLEEVKPTRIDV
jgi:hypothetical protein